VNPRLTLEELCSDPDLVTQTLKLSDGQRVRLRLLRGEDAVLLGAYFESLSARTRQMFAPHQLTATFACQLCASLDYTHSLRFLAEVLEPYPACIAYIILGLRLAPEDVSWYRAQGFPLDSHTVGVLAPSVADAWQDRGVATALLPPILDVAKRLDRPYIVLMGGVRINNLRAVHVYQKLGFRTLATVSTQKDEHMWVVRYEMALDLTEAVL
jgi:GNAT superfamily N-acetyltransferase